MYTLDANIFVRIAQPNHPNYTTCESLIMRLSQDSTPIITPLIVLPEVAGAIRRETGDSIRARLFVDLVRSLPTIQLVALDPVLAMEAAEIAADEALRGMDAIYVAVARHFNCTFVTLDDEARRRATRIIPAMTPNEVLAQ